MRKIVIFTMILTLIFGTVGCTAHSKPDKKAIENSSTNAVIDTTQSEELTEKTESEAVEKARSRTCHLRGCEKYICGRNNTSDYC